MRVTSKGQVTIPVRVRETLGIRLGSHIDFREDNGRFYIIKVTGEKQPKRFSRFRGIATAQMTTDEIMNLTRE